MTEFTLSLVIMKVMTIEIADMMLSGYNSNQCDLNCTYEMGGMHYTKYGQKHKVCPRHNASAASQLRRLQVNNNSKFSLEKNTRLDRREQIHL